MGLTSAAVSRFRAAVQATLAELLPATLIIDGTTLTDAVGPGGRVITEFIAGGESTNYRFPFRVPMTSTPEGWTPQVGAACDWQLSETQLLPLEIVATAIHPHEATWEFTARLRRIP